MEDNQKPKPTSAVVLSDTKIHTIAGAMLVSIVCKDWSIWLRRVDIKDGFANVVEGEWTCVGSCPTAVKSFQTEMNTAAGKMFISIVYEDSSMWLNQVNIENGLISAIEGDWKCIKAPLA